MTHTLIPSSSTRNPPKQFFYEMDFPSEQVFSWAMAITILDGTLFDIIITILILEFFSVFAATKAGTEPALDFGGIRGQTKLGSNYLAQ